MAYWLASTTHKHDEFRVRDAINDLGAYAWVPRRVDSKKVPQRRAPIAIVAPLVQNYLFIACTDEQWHQLRQDVRGLWPEMTRISGSYWERRLAPYIAENDAAHDTRLAQIEAGERLEKFHDGDALRVILGGLTGQKVTFRSLVEDTALDSGLKLVAEIGSIAGKVIQMTFDPAQVEWLGPA